MLSKGIVGEQQSLLRTVGNHGGRDKEVAIEVDKDKMAAYKLTLAKIVAAVKAENQLLPSGSVYTEQTKSDVRVIAQYKKAADIEKIVVKNTDSQNIPLTAVAVVKEQDARVDRYGRVNGKDAVTMRKKYPEAHRPFRCPAIYLIGTLAVISCGYIMYNLSAMTWERFFVWSFIGILIYFFYGYSHSRENNAGNPVK